MKLFQVISVRLTAYDKDFNCQQGCDFFGINEIREMI